MWKKNFTYRYALSTIISIVKEKSNIISIFVNYYVLIFLLSCTLKTINELFVTILFITPRSFIHNFVMCILNLLNIIFFIITIHQWPASLNQIDITNVALDSGVVQPNSIWHWTVGIYSGVDQFFVIDTINDSSQLIQYQIDGCFHGYQLFECWAAAGVDELGRGLGAWRQTCRRC